MRLRRRPFQQCDVVFQTIAEDVVVRSIECDFALPLHLPTRTSSSTKSWFAYAPNERKPITLGQAPALRRAAQGWLPPWMLTIV